MARIALVTAALLALFATSCVVSTFEGPSEPPRVAPRLPAPEIAPEASASPHEPFEIAASHILIQYRGAMRAPPSVTRSKSAARKRALEVLARARAGEDFTKLAAEYSDEPGAAARGGKLGRFTRDMMTPKFSDAAFKLGVGQISDIVETPFGFHVIKRTE